ncbi:Plastocyanin-like protein [Corchorus olitorius]|uniref:Plastocyanin-like protein n=1 Tax=Corchorus olitorius TaxID=93759 RepID=A0A1R3H035_9ROSI|nr:Plastocyanin-like protein [Corchorus olitorius]
MTFLRQYVVFEYNNSTDDVRQVSLEDFESCDGTSFIASYTSGSDTVALDKAGHYYFISGVAGHCKAGQKVNVLVQPGPFASPREITEEDRGLFESIAVFLFPIMDIGSAKLQSQHHGIISFHKITICPRAVFVSLICCSTMASAKGISLILIMLPTLFGVSLAAIYKVGDSTGWNIKENFDFGNWASNNTFQVSMLGTIFVIFEYNNSTDDVRKVSLDDFESCNGTSAIASYTSGSDTVALHKAGRHYFVSGVAACRPLPSRPKG